MMKQNELLATTGERREEMREIKEILAGEPPYDLRGVTKALRDMKKLWIEKGVDSLIGRREREARFVENAICTAGRYRISWWIFLFGVCGAFSFHHFFYSSPFLVPLL
jgi:hypothetical protein